MDWDTYYGGRFFDTTFCFIVFDIVIRINVRYILVVFLCMASGMMYAQKKEISSARDDVHQGKNLENAEKTMQRLLRDSANRRNEKIWEILFDSQRKQYEQGNEKLYLNQKYDTLTLFNTASRMFTSMEAYDSIDALPDKKGRVRPRYRKDNSELLNTLRPNLYRGGLFLLHRQKYAEAYALFCQYLDCASQPLFADYHYAERDTQMSAAAYWALYSAYKMNDAVKVLHHAPLALTDGTHHELVLQHLSETYFAIKDTMRAVAMLRDGFSRYPHTSYFYTHLIDYFTQTRQWDEALVLTDSALHKDSANVVYPLTKSSILLNKGCYKESYAISDSLLQHNDSLTEAHLYAGLAKFNEAVTLDKMTQTSKRRKAIIKLYREALPHLEIYRKDSPDRMDLWGLPLYTIYLNLNMGKQFDEIDKLMKK
jgi:hypothetical protein